MHRRMRKLLSKLLLSVLVLVYFLTFLVLSGDSIIVTEHKSNTPHPKYVPPQTSKHTTHAENYEEISDYEVVKNRKPFGLTSNNNNNNNNNNTTEMRSETELLRLSDLGDYFRRQLIDQPLLCSENEDMPEGPFLLLLVNSHVLNVARRNAIRDTWGRIARDYDDTHHVILVFLLGDTDVSEDRVRVTKENKTYRDILQWNFRDNYQNLSLKSLLGMWWTTEHCRQANYIMKTDDDVFLNASSITQYLAHADTSIKNRTSYMIGHRNSKSPVLRIGNWGVSNHDYPYPTYPPYCSGAAYIVTRETTQTLRQTILAHSALDILPVEDVFITGILASRSGFTCMHDSHFPGWMTLITVDSVVDLLNNTVYGIHGVSYTKMFLLWKIMKTCSECGSYPAAIEDLMTRDTDYFMYYDNMDDGFTDL